VATHRQRVTVEQIPFDSFRKGLDFLYGVVSDFAVSPNNLTDPRAEIICALGPASSSPKVIDAVVRAGMDVARLNFSHGTQEEASAQPANANPIASALLAFPSGRFADLSSKPDGRACCGLISLGYEIGPAEDQTHA